MAVVNMKPGSPVHARWMSYGYSVLASDCLGWANDLQRHADELRAMAAHSDATPVDRAAARRALRTADQARAAAEVALDAHRHAHHESVSGAGSTRYTRTSNAATGIYEAYRKVEALLASEGLSRHD